MGTANYIVRSICIFIGLIGQASTGFAAQLCSMTFNSPNEKRVLETVYGKSHELVPDSKDPHWLDRACSQNIKCDILVISGHFGGLFFGESTSPTLDLKKLESLSCAQSCPSIMNAKSVYLMGCNTLADKKPDTRSIDSYLRVLVTDGFPRSFAEEVATSRYLDAGRSIAERMAVAFQNSEVIFGFRSKGPLGVAAEPKLKSGLSGASSTSLETSMKKAFQGTSFDVIHPKREAGALAKLSCGLRSADSMVRYQSFRQVFESDQTRRYFDQILQSARDVALLKVWREASSSVRRKVESIANDLLKKSEGLLGIQVRVLDLKQQLGLVTPNEYAARVDRVLTHLLLRTNDYISVDQVCDLAESDPFLSFKAKWLKTNSSDLAFAARAAHCFARLDPDAITALKYQSLQTSDRVARRESFRALNGLWAASEKGVVEAASARFSLRDRAEALASIASIRPRIADACAVPSGLDPQRADDARYNCFMSQLSAFSTLAECQATTAGFQTMVGIGPDLNCLQKFKNSMSVTSCLAAASHYSNPQTAKYQPEKSDDFLFRCWDDLRAQKDVGRSECLGISRAMLIQGNQIKQNWNCVNQI